MPLFAGLFKKILLDDAEGDIVVPPRVDTYSLLLLSSESVCQGRCGVGGKAVQ